MGTNDDTNACLLIIIILPSLTDSKVIIMMIMIIMMKMILKNANHLDATSFLALIPVLFVCTLCSNADNCLLELQQTHLSLLMVVMFVV